MRTGKRWQISISQAGERGSKHFYDDLGNEVGSADFSNGELDAGHCTSWSFTKSESEVTGTVEEDDDNDDAITTTITYSKELNPSAYQSEADADNYYNQFDDSVLSETVTESISDAEGNTLSQTSTITRGKNKSQTVTTYESDDFGRTVKENSITKNYKNNEWLTGYETETLSTYDDNGNVCQTETKSRKEGESQWQSKVVKIDYDEQGQVVKEYTPRGVKEDAATKYTYDILGQLIQSEIPQEKKDGSIQYQTTTSEYDKSGNVTKKEEQINSDRTDQTEYTYDELGNLVMVKNCLEDKAQYVQYVYDSEGNKVRQFTGMTEPLTIEVEETDDKSSEETDTFTYGNKTYQVKVSGKKKSDNISETKYEYDGKDQLISYTDPEGRTENYTYDINSNLTKTVDKNGNTFKNSYDYQNRLVEAVEKEKKTKKETTHTYAYDSYGNIKEQDDTIFEYDDISGQVIKETTKLTKNKDVVKNYTYDSAGNKSSFAVKVDGNTELSLQYTYDGESKLTSVTDENGEEVVGYAYDTDGNLSERTVVGNGMTTSYAYDYQNRLTSLKNSTSSGVISEYTSEYLTNGQKSKEVSKVENKDGKTEEKIATYAYDLMGRIEKETKTGSEDITYTYDSHNNRKQMTVGNKVTAYRYNRNDELIRTDTLNTETEEDSVILYKYDKNGNELAMVNRYEIPSEKKDKPFIDIDVTLGDNRLNENVVNHYNAKNQLVKTLTKNYKVSFTYDAEGLRTSKTVNGETTVYVWDGDQLVMELSEGGKVQKRYIRGNDLVFADEGENSETLYYVTDSHGNVVQMTDDSGKVTKTYEYDSFGNEVKSEKKDENPFRYCGEYYDKETEEVYLRARYYQPAVGRFLTKDSYTGESDEPESLHLYTYCENDGMNAWDPGGHDGASLELKTYYSAVSTGNSRWNMTRACGRLYREDIDYQTGGLVKQYSINELNVCTDGKVSKIMKDKHFYGDKNHGKKNKTSCFGKKVAADKIPYIVVPPSKSSYKFSSGVIVNQVDGSYLYCVVAEVGPDKTTVDEVSIYAAWIMAGIDPPESKKQVKKEHMIGNDAPEGAWRIILFQSSSPKPKEKNKKYGWKYKKVDKFREQIKTIGEQHYYSTGECLNDNI